MENFRQTLQIPGKNPHDDMSAELGDESRHSLFRVKVRLYHAVNSVPAMGTAVLERFSENFSRVRENSGE